MASTRVMNLIERSHYLLQKKTFAALNSSRASKDDLFGTPRQFPAGDPAHFALALVVGPTQPNNKAAAFSPLSPNLSTEKEEKRANKMGTSLP